MTRCVHPRCKTILSIYNPGTKCSLHKYDINTTYDIKIKKHTKCGYKERSCLYCKKSLFPKYPRQKHCHTKCQYLWHVQDQQINNDYSKAKTDFIEELRRRMIKEKAKKTADVNTNVLKKS